MTDIVVIGSVNLDLSASVSRLPAAGETVTGAKLSRFPGGKGANQALAAQRLGANVKLIACVGDDATADEALVLLREGGVDLHRCIIDSEAPTGVALIPVAVSMARAQSPSRLTTMGSARPSARRFLSAP